MASALAEGFLRMNNITSPIFLVEDEDIMIFANPRQAELDLEPIDVRLGGFVMYDSVGRLLKIETLNWKGNRVTAIEEQPTHQKDLEGALRRFLKASKVPEGEDARCDLPCLVQACGKLA